MVKCWVPSLIIMIVLAGCGISLPVELLDSATPAAVEEPSETVEAVLAYAAYAQSVDADGLPILGDLDAPVSVTLYSSFTCPACANFNGAVMPTLIEDYVATGQINLTFSPMLIPLSAEGERTSAIALCLAERGLFWELHDAIFAASRDLGAPDAVSGAVYGAFADTYDVSSTQILQCVDGDDVIASLNASEQNALDAGLSGVPSVQVNDGDLISGATLDVVIAEIEAALAGE